MSLMRPDRYFDRITSIDIKRDIVDQGFRCVLLDIDNTIRSREDGLVPDDVALWLRVLRASGVRACLLSNNWHANAHELARGMGLPIVAKACKPLPHGYVAACRKMGVKRREMLMIGDQLSTDVIGAKAVGIAAYLVRPLAQVDLAHMRHIRKIEERLLDGVPLEGIDDQA